MTLSPEDFAALTGANVDFNPAYAGKWMLFWKTDICEKDEFHTCFPQLSLAETQRVWMAMEEHFLSKWPPTNEERDIFRCEGAAPALPGFMAFAPTDSEERIRPLLLLAP